MTANTLMLLFLMCEQNPCTYEVINLNQGWDRQVLTIRTGKSCHRIATKTGMHDYQEVTIEPCKISHE